MKERVILISGGTRGLGRKIVEYFSVQGDKVCFIYKDSSVLAKEICHIAEKESRQVAAFQGNVTDAKQLKKIVREVLLNYGKIDVLINNAGVAKETLFVKINADDWDEVVRCNLKSVYLLCKEVSKAMIKKKKGHIVNISSIVGLEGRKTLSSYAASKAGVIALTKSLAKEFGGYNVKVNTVLPGFLMTNMTKNVSKEELKNIKKNNVLNRLNEPEEIAKFLYNLSYMDNVSGQIFNLDSRIYKTF